MSQKQRPLNSLLEEDVDFERGAKIAPQITEEVTKDIEEILKKRIKEVFYSVVLL